MLTDPTDFAGLDAHRDYRTAVPTPDHFISALYLAGPAGAEEHADTRVLVDGYAYESLSTTAYTLGTECPPVPEAGGSPEATTDVPWTARTCDRSGGLR